MDFKKADAMLARITRTEGPQAAMALLKKQKGLSPEHMAFGQKIIAENSQGYNTGGMVEEDIWGTDPLATMAPTTNVPQAMRPQAPTAAAPTPKPGLAQKAAPLAAQAAVGAALGDPMSWANIAKAGVPLFFNKGGSVMKKYNAGGWVGKRAAYLNMGGMALEDASMQAYNEMQGMTGPDPVGAEFMMPDGSPEPETHTMPGGYEMPGEYHSIKGNTTLGYVPSAGPLSTKEQMEVDKLNIQREKAMADEDRKEEAFMMQQEQKKQMHDLQMQQKKESHAEAMKQKKGPLVKGD